jgi:hypothetical protein
MAEGDLTKTNVTVVSSGPVRVSYSGSSSSGGVMTVKQSGPTTVLKTASSSVSISSKQKNVFIQASPGPQGIPGPAGPIGPIGPVGSGTAEEEVYSTRVDFVNDNLLYRAEAPVGTADSAPFWRIRRIVIGNDGDVTEVWANGNANFVNIWDNRTFLSYS